MKKEETPLTPETGTPAPGAPVDETGNKGQEMKTPIKYAVILAFSGTEEKMSKLWEKAGLDVPFVVISVPEDYKTLDILPSLLVDESIGDEFVLIPANTFPAGRITEASICIPRVYIQKDGREIYDSFFPIFIEKDYLEEILKNDKLTALGSEAVVKALVTHIGRPEQGGFSFGNAICPVTRATPCEHVVIEALLKKLFIGCNRAGWDGIASLTDKLVADE